MNWTTWRWLAMICMVLALVGSLYMGLFQYTETYEAYQNNFIFYHKHFNQAYVDLGHVNSFIHNKLLANPLLHKFKPSYMGFYYDNPEWTDHPRSTIGVSMQGTTPQIDSYFASFGYSKIVLPGMKMLQVDFPYKNRLSHIVCFKFGMSALISSLTTQKYVKIFQNSNLPFIEEATNNSIQLMFPIGVNNSLYSISTSPEPELNEKGRIYKQKIELLANPK